MKANYPLLKGAPTNDPKKIIIHAMAEFIVNEDKQQFAPLFLESIGFSAHSLIAPSGVNIRCREDKQGAYHAKGFNKNTFEQEKENKNSYHRPEDYCRNRKYLCRRDLMGLKSSSGNTLE